MSSDPVIHESMSMFFQYPHVSAVAEWHVHPKNVQRNLKTAQIGN
jgi:hypothetical protein